MQVVTEYNFNNLADIYNIFQNNYNETIEKFNTNYREMDSSTLQTQKIILTTLEHKEFCLSGIKIRFDDDIWDFSSIYVEGKARAIYRLDFQNKIFDSYEKKPAQIIFNIRDDNVWCG